MGLAYYNEIDPKAAAWLRELIKAGQIAPGEVDERSIEDIKPDELAAFTQCHFFAGIGGWSYTLRLVGWSDERAVWTGSCPCQPFSAAGKRAGFADERHLWPAWHHLIRECRPRFIFGEQVANALGWFDLVSSDLAGEGYASGAVIIGAHSVGAPHIRQRLYWVANSQSRDGRLSVQPGRPQQDCAEFAWRGEAVQLADHDSARLSDDIGRQRSARQDRRTVAATDRLNPWANAEWLACTDGKHRAVEPGTFPLAHGIPGRVGLLRGYGNAIVPQVAATFITSFLESLHQPETLQ